MPQPMQLSVINAFITFMVPRPRRSVARNLHKTLQQDMQRLTRRASLKSYVIL